MTKEDVREVIDKVIERLVREEFLDRIKRIEERLDALESDGSEEVYIPGPYTPVMAPARPVITGTMAYAVGELSAGTSGDITITSTGTSGSFTMTQDLFGPGALPHTGYEAPADSIRGTRVNTYISDDELFETGEYSEP